jgi:hypothetical protein
MKGKRYSKELKARVALEARNRVRTTISSASDAEVRQPSSTGVPRGAEPCKCGGTLSGAWRSETEKYERYLKMCQRQNSSQPNSSVWAIHKVRNRD